MSWLSKFSKWWNTNVIHHGESDNISYQIGLSESDMSKALSDSNYEKWLNALSNPVVKKWAEGWRVRLGLQNKDWSYFYKNRVGRILSAIAVLFVGHGLNLDDVFSNSSTNGLDDVIYDLGEDNDDTVALFNHFKSDNQLQIDSIIKKIQSQFSDNSQSWTNVFGGFFQNLLSGLGSSFAGMSSQFANSWLNKKNMMDLIDYQNAYNTPKAQMERFADAGLNPNLVYGLGSNGNQPSSGSIAPVDFDTSQRENRLAKMQIETQMAQAKADIAEKQSRTNLTNEQAQSTRNQNTLFQLYGLEQAQAELNHRYADLEKARAESRSAQVNAQLDEELKEVRRQIVENEKSVSDLRKSMVETDESSYGLFKFLQLLGMGTSSFSHISGSFR